MPSLADSTPAMLLKAYIVRYVTITKGLTNAFSGWSFKYGKLPADPAQVIALIDQGGPTSFPNLSVDFLGLQVLVRSISGGSGYQSSRLMAELIRDAIVGMPGHPPEFEELDGVTQRGQIVPLGYDDQDRHVWSANYQLIVEPVPSALSHRASM